MRVRKKKDGLTVLGVGGAYVVSLGLNMSKADMNGVLGFAVERTDHEDGEVAWMRGIKTFEATDPKLGPGAMASSHDHPFQTFQWSDYSAFPERDYTYRVVAMRGTPEKLVDGETVEIKVTTESERLGKHAVFFNRGAIASQEYARRFLNKKPSVVGEPAYKWLSRGLVEALLEYIGQADSAKHELYGAIYQFQNKDVFAALKKAKAAGAKVRIIYDDHDQADLNEAALEGSGIKSLCTGRTNSGKYAHNKFFVLKKDGKPVSVWTGSTNLTENGIYGHSNNAHIVRDRAVAQAYLDYWDELKGDPERAELAPFNTENSPAPVDPFDRETVAVFSPRSGLEALDWYADIAGNAKRALFMTFAFGMNKRFVKSYARKDDVLRFALMENKGMKPAQQAEVDKVRRLPNCVVAVGKNIAVNSFDRWLKEISQIEKGVHVRYVHTKYMLVDPLGDEPMVVVGSANFSEASTDTNDENMLVIRGNKAVADIYLGEFMRLHTHYAFRESLTFKNTGEVRNPKFLIPSSKWINDRYFQDGSDRSLRRVYFSGG
jgi:phosphatidylserine/phosphatidylglycerophosphate/cardiolipin synthase-like enzyme